MTYHSALRLAEAQAKGDPSSRWQLNLASSPRAPVLAADSQRQCRPWDGAAGGVAALDRRLADPREFFQKRPQSQTPLAQRNGPGCCMSCCCVLLSNAYVAAEHPFSRICCVGSWHHLSFSILIATSGILQVRESFTLTERE